MTRIPVFRLIGRRHIQKAVLFGFGTFAVLMFLFGARFAAYYDLIKARAALRDRDSEAALRYLNHANAQEPMNAEVQFLLARCYRRLGQPTAVRKNLDAALRLGYSRKAIQREEWLTMAQSGQLAEAQPHLSELLIDAEDDGVEICEAYVNGYFLTARFHEAFDLLGVWQSSFPRDAQPYLFRGRLLEVQQNPKGAAAAYREGLHREPHRQDLQLNLARCLIKLHEHSSAVEILNRLEAQTPSNPDVLQNLGDCLLQQGQLSDSIKILKRLLDVEPRHPDGRLTLARVYLQEQRNDEAFHLLKELVAERPYDVEARYSYALTLLAAGQKELAAEEFRFVAAAREAMSNTRLMMDVVSQKEPDNFDLRYQIGLLLLQYESPSAGAGWLRSVLEINPNHRPTHEALASYYDQIQNTELANRHRERLRELPETVITPPDAATDR